MENTKQDSLKSIACLSTSTSSQLSDTKNVKMSVEDNTTMLPLIIKAMNETIVEKRCRGKDISKLLSHLEIDPKSMPKDIEDSWAKASAIMRLEALSRIDPVSLALHMERNKRDVMKKRREERKLKNRFNGIQDSQTSVLEKTNGARQSIDLLEKVLNKGSNDEACSVNRLVNAVKLNDYKEILKKSETSLKELGADHFLPEKILNKYDACLKLNEELNKVEQSLSKYSSLPPHLSEARAELADKEKYLEDLEHAIFQKMK